MQSFKFTIGPELQKLGMKARFEIFRNCNAELALSN